MENTVKNTIKSRKIAALISDGFDAKQLEAMKKALKAEGAQLKIVATRLGSITGEGGEAVVADFSFLTAASVLFDAVYVPGGAKSVEALSLEADACQFVNEAYKHCKAICSTGEAVEFLKKTFAANSKDDKAIIFGKMPVEAPSDFIRAIGEHRNWGREAARKSVV